jgi:hypothetical protein
MRQTTPLLRFALALVVPGAVLAAVPACSSTTPAIPRVILDSTIGPGKNSQSVCQISSQPWVEIGNFGGIGTPPNPIDTDKDYGSGKVTVTCSVLAEGDAFRVSASASQSGSEGGTVTITGLFTTAREPQPNITVVFNRIDYGRFEQKDCVANYDVNPSAGVASGRVWAQVTCPTAVSNSNGERKCETYAQFRFENCEQPATTAN